MNDEKQRNKLQDLEKALSEFSEQLQERNEKITNIKENFDRLRNKAKYLQHALQSELNSRGHELNLKVTIREVSFEDIKDKPEISQLPFQNKQPYFFKFWALEVTHTKIQLVKPKQAVIYTEYFPVIETGDSKVPEFLDDIKKVDGVIPYLNNILAISLEDILVSMDRDATPIVRANLEELKNNS